MTASPTTAVRRWLFSPLDTAPIAALRIACGLLVVGWTVSLLPDVSAFLSDDGLTRSAVHGTRGWWTVDLVWPWAAVGLLLVAAVALLVGWHTRVAAVFVWLLLIAVQRRDVYMTLPVARDLAAAGIRLNCVAPGLIDTPIYGEGPASEAFKDTLKRDVVFPKRLGTADELASIILELLTNTYANGETVRLDGAARLQPK